jgi:uncharacterized membrane protein YgcG
MLNELLAGQELTITRAVGGTGTVDVADLESQTGVADEKQELQLVGVSNLEQGKKVSIRIDNVALEEAYTLNQVAVYAKLSREEEENLLFIMQDEQGLYIPDSTETPEFSVEIYAFIAMTNDVKISLVVDPSGMVTEKVLEDKIAEHNEAEDSHQDIRETVSDLSGTVSSIRGNISTINSNISSLRSRIQAIDPAAVTVLDISIPAGDWVLQEPEDGAAQDDYPYVIEIDCTEATAEQYPVVSLHKNSLDIAKAASLCPDVETMDGKLRFWAVTQPEQTIEATIALLLPGSGVSWSGGSGSSGGSSGSGSGTGGSSGSGGGSSGGSGDDGDSAATEPFVAEEATYATQEAVDDMLDDIFS